MRFGGHETFPIREGWLHKGLNLLFSAPEKLAAKDAPDHLGVGRNMAKSIRHWLLATELAERVPGKRGLLTYTELGEFISARDPYFLETGTWWALHANLVNNEQHAGAWVWFFNSFHLNRFERGVCVESLRRHLQLARRRVPSAKTLERDVACLLNSYARTIPPKRGDPEEASECPFLELGLLHFFPGSGYYQLNRQAKNIAPDLLGYAFAKAFPDARAGEGTTDIRLEDAARHFGGPGRVFVLSPETLFEQARAAEDASEDFAVVGLAAERVVRVTRRSPLEWLMRYYDAVQQEGRQRYAA